jgi:hypothetical protein
MVYRGHVKNGMVVFESDPPPPEGAEVEVILREPISEESPDHPCPTLYERLKDVIGVVDDLPPDFARNHDHYLYGTPKE